VRLDGLVKLKKINDVIGNQTSDLPTCSTNASTNYATECPRFHAVKKQNINTREINVFFEVSGVI
jgi:hypothetical protein